MIELIGFSINPFHNLVHLAIGGFLIIMSRQGTSTAEGACLGVGLFYVTAFVIGVVGGTNLTIISMQGAGDLENFNHLVNGVLLLGVGLVSSGATEAQFQAHGHPGLAGPSRRAAGRAQRFAAAGIRGILAASSLSP